MNEAEPSHRAAPSPLPRDANSRLQPSLQPTFDPSCSPSTDTVRKQEVSQDGLTSCSSHFRPADGIAASPRGQPTRPPPPFPSSLSPFLLCYGRARVNSHPVPLCRSLIHQWRASAAIGNPSGGIIFFSFLNQRIPRHAAANTREDRKLRGVSGWAEQEVKVLYCTLGGKWLQLTMLKKNTKPTNHTAN